MSPCNPLPNWLQFEANASVSNFNNFLQAIPSHEEVTAALFSMHPYKAAGINGFQPAFFQKT
ncbi:ribonuclease H [Senna tora]|uniref:Ribonuclease H n=1 Tax=Senna tora TaxID=362788 RepID=A0A834WPM0_9FABA|nr:ribonuclease H [Senna tora]